MRKLVIAGLLATGLAGCSTYPYSSDPYPRGTYASSGYYSGSSTYPGYYSQPRSSSLFNGTNVGALLGAGAGAYAGNQFGSGKGKWGTTAAGALLGGGAGAYLGNSFDRSN
jgi:outer membrane lipoprotein SlyB